ncbi:MAG: hypothetical protein ACMG51_08320 [Ginsengibacter sp.]
MQKQLCFVTNKTNSHSICLPITTSDMKTLIKEKKLKQTFLVARILITCFLSILILGLLLWQHFHGGGPSHHILARKDMPEISNWWGVLLLPILTWILLIRIENRINNQGILTQRSKIRIFVLFFLGLILGIVLAISFANNFKSFLDNFLYIILILSLFVPTYFSEFILGFILGMTYTFGAVLPTAFMLIIAIFGFLIYRFIRPLFLRLKFSVNNR